MGLASFLNVFFLSQYGLTKSRRRATSPRSASIAGSCLRPLGGYLADRFGGIRMLTGLYLAVGTLCSGLSTLPPLYAGTLSVVRGDGPLGMGNGAVFQIVPQRFPRRSVS